MDTKDLIIVIPAYEPDMELVKLIDKLEEYFVSSKIVLVNDGSIGFDDVFNQVKNRANVIYLNHEKNMGKGKALKTAFQFIKELGIEGTIVTADSDGQHKPEDIKRVYEFSTKNPNSLVLGSRKFDCDVPKRSTFGNDVARGLLRLSLNKHLNDTQTGLRAFRTSLIDFMLKLDGDRYEYEMNMLSEAIRENIDIKELAIETIYINENKGSHFRPVRDFTRICSQTVKYLIVNFIALMINLLVYSGLALLFKEVLHKETFEATDNLFIITASSVFTFFIHATIHMSGLFYGNSYIFKIKNKLYIYLAKVFTMIVLDFVFTYMFIILTNDIILSKVFTVLILIFLHLFYNYFALSKSRLYED